MENGKYQYPGLTVKRTLRDYRYDQSLSIKELAQVAGVSVTSISAIESGRSLGTFITWRKIAAALSVNPRDIAEYNKFLEKRIRPSSARMKAIVTNRNKKLASVN